MSSGWNGNMSPPSRKKQIITRAHSFNLSSTRQGYMLLTATSVPLTHSLPPFILLKFSMYALSPSNVSLPPLSLSLPLSISLSSSLPRDTCWMQKLSYGMIFLSLPKHCLIIWPIRFLSHLTHPFSFSLFTHAQGHFPSSSLLSLLWQSSLPPSPYSVSPSPIFAFVSSSYPLCLSSSLSALWNLTGRQHLCPHKHPVKEMNKNRSQNMKRLESKMKCLLHVINMSRETMLNDQLIHLAFDISSNWPAKK